MARPSKYPPEFRERAVRMVRRSERPIAAVARDLGIDHETLRQWVRADEANDGSRSNRLSSAEREELSSLRREVRELRRANEILKAPYGYRGRGRRSRSPERWRGRRRGS